MKKRICFECKIEYPATPEYFYRNRTFLLGISYRCKKCDIKAKKEYWEKNKDRIYRNQKKYYYTQKKQKKYRKNNPIKICYACKQRKPRTLKYFHNVGKSRRDGLSGYCKDCIRKKWKMRLYNISPEEYRQLYEKYNSCCAICGRNEKILKGSLHIDHNHKNNKIRGLLCYDCNRALGLFKDNPLILMKAIKYIQKKEYPESQK